MEEKNWDKGDGQSHNLDYLRQNILTPPNVLPNILSATVPSTSWNLETPPNVLPSCWEQNLFGRFGAKFWIKILYTKLLSRFPLPEFRFLLIEEKNWDKGDGQSYNLNYSRQNILSATVPSTIWRNLQISKICFRFGLYYSQQKFWPGFAFQKSCSSFQISISVSVFRFQKGCSLLLAEYFASHCGIRSFNSQRCTLFGLYTIYNTMQIHCDVIQVNSEFHYMTTKGTLSDPKL